MEMVTMARKPFPGTVAANVMQHGTGAINVDGCRVGTSGGTTKANIRTGEVNGARAGTSMGENISFRCDIAELNAGRWPANLIHDGSDEVLAGFPETKSGGGDRRGKQSIFGGEGDSDTERAFEANSGSAARFFYCPKASKADRSEGLDGMPQKMPHPPSGDGRAWDIAGSKSTARENHHPTVKPTALMQYLCRLVTPPGGTVLDPFTGSGSTGKAAMLEGFNFIGFEREAEYVEIARRRIAEAAARPMLEGIK
jgi:site-specific DNA-methyltransferase (adenine-specific)